MARDDMSPQGVARNCSSGQAWWDGVRLVKKLSSLSLSLSGVAGVSVSAADSRSLIYCSPVTYLHMCEQVKHHCFN